MLSKPYWEKLNPDELYKYIQLKRKCFSVIEKIENIRNVVEHVRDVIPSVCWDIKFVFCSEKQQN